MAGHQTYEEQKALVFRGLMILGIITVVEVLIALFAKGHLVPGIKFNEGFGHYVYMLFMIGFSLYKAYFIVFYFMHMAYEVRGLVMSVLLPTLLLVWAIIAFFQEGNSWGERREQLRRKNEEVVRPLPSRPQGFYRLPNSTSLRLPVAG
ncbi:MAG: cytochrome C oxidase subunit IV family protein [Saprospiraceae bacterium]|nr:cytochrome C oxidase subunit IV family protein [Saprospiraceae bacterium]MDW8482771.1 cytochrome C oxidase subunit IV family protein [Saprospiraceae bacterium]